MYWLRFSKAVQYLTTFIIHVISVALTYNIFFSPQSTAYLYEGLSSIAVYHRNASNRYWFVFSSLISMLLLGCSIAYYTYSYWIVFYDALHKYRKSAAPTKSLLRFILAEDFYSMNLVDFGFVALSIAWNIIWAIHLLLQIIQSALNHSVGHYLVSYEEASLLLLLSTQITLIALRYPLLFQSVGTTTAPIEEEKDIVREAAKQVIKSSKFAKMQLAN